MADWTRLRAEFPALANWTYLNSATYGQTPLRAQSAIQDHLLHRDAFACSDFLSWFDDADRWRSNIGRLIGCSGDDIAFLPTASSALSLLMSGIEWRPGDRIVTMGGEFPNNLYGPALALNADFVTVDWDRFYEALTSSTRLVVLSTVNYGTGFRPPLEELSDHLRSRGILFYLDGTQSVGALQIDVSRIRPTMMAVDAYKWMLTPNGAGFCYIGPEARAWLRPHCIGWRSHWDWRAVDNLHTGTPVFADRAEKYEGGMIPFPLLAALNSVVEMMLEIGPAEIEKRVLDLAGELEGRMIRFGAAPLHRGSQILALRFPERDASALARSLKERHRVLVSARYGSLRVSVHFYNGESDLDRFESAIQASC
jgi:selenocysteine lyase/cysteine desulfurase